METVYGRCSLIGFMKEFMERVQGGSSYKRFIEGFMEKVYGRIPREGVHVGGSWKSLWNE
jgi:hypothetical protein